MTKVKLTTIGNSVGIVLPREVLTLLRSSKGDLLSVTETPRGVELSPYDPEFEKQMDLAEEIMREDRDVLRRLAK